MTPEDWRRGIENEAEHVADRSWAAQTRRTAFMLPLRRDFRHLGWLLVYSVLVGTVLLLLSTWAVVEREALRNGLTALDFVRMGVFGNPVPINTETHSTDSGLPLGPLLFLLGLGACVAGKRGAPAWAVIVSVMLTLPALQFVRLLTFSVVNIGLFDGSRAQYLLLAVSLLGWALGVTLRHFRSGSRADSVAPH